MFKPIIMTGDLSMVPPIVARAVSSQYGHHRFAWFQDVLNYISDYFVKVFGSDYQALLLTSTLSGAKEALDFNNFKVIDVSDSLGVNQASFQDGNVDAYVIAPERALMGIPGTAIVIIKRESVSRLKENLDQLKLKPYLLDVVKAYDVWNKKQTTPYSPSISSVVGLASALRFIESQGGLNKHVERHQKLATFIRRYLQKNNFILEDKKTNTHTVCKVPIEIKAEDLVNKLATENIFIKLIDNNTIKIGHIGYVDNQSLERFIGAFDKALNTKTEISFQVIEKYLFNTAEKISEIIFNTAKEKLLTPGPTFFNPKVFDVMDSYTYCNSEKFINDFCQLSSKLSAWFKAHNPALILSGPSTGFMEAAISDLTKADDRGLVISHGKFGDRWMEICQAKSRNFVSLALKDEEWGQAFSLEDIENFLKKQDKKINFICFQQTETSSGVSYVQRQIEQIVKAARQHNPDMIIIMDLVSGAFAHDIDFDKADIDAMVIGSQKGLGISSGIAFLTISDRAIKKLEENQEQNIGYLNIRRLLQGIFEKKMIDMPNIFHVYSALKSLDLIEKLGGRNYFIEHHAKLAKQTRDGLRELGLSFLGQEPYLSNAVTVALFPENIDARQIKKTLKEEYGISVAGAQSDYWKPRFIRIGHLGYVSEQDINDLLQALKIILSD